MADTPTPTSGNGAAAPTTLPPTSTPPGWHDAAHALWQRGNRPGAVQAAFADINRFGADKPAPRVLQLVYYLFLLGDPGGAATLLEHLLQHQPGHLEARVNLAVCRQRLGQHADAARHAQAVVAQRPAHALALDVLAKSLHQLGQDNEAADAGTRALKAKGPCRRPRTGRLAPARRRPWQRGRRTGQAPRHRLFVVGRAAALPARRAAQCIAGARPVCRLDAALPCGRHGARRLHHTADASWVPRCWCKPAGHSTRQRLCWRFQVANDPAVGRFLVRDADAVFSLREAQAVQAWCVVGPLVPRDPGLVDPHRPGAGRPVGRRGRRAARPVHPAGNTTTLATPKPPTSTNGSCATASGR